VIVRFPPRRGAAIFICRSRDDDGWLTLAGAHGWQFGSLTDARAEARWLSLNSGFPIRELITEHSP
jgi:hypothetical protein